MSSTPSQPQITSEVARLLKGRGFQRTATLARRLRCDRSAIVEAFAAVQVAQPSASFIRIYGHAGGMGRA